MNGKHTKQYIIGNDHIHIHNRRYQPNTLINQSINHLSTINQSTHTLFFYLSTYTPGKHNILTGNSKVLRCKKYVTKFVSYRIWNTGSCMYIYVYTMYYAQMKPNRIRFLNIEYSMQNFASDIPIAHKTVFEWKKWIFSY